MTNRQLDSDRVYAALDAWIDQHFEEQVQFLQKLIQIPTDTPPGNNAPHAEASAEWLQAMGFEVEKDRVEPELASRAGLQSITNLIVRRPYGSGGRTIALNAHGDVVPPGEGWTHDPYGAEVIEGYLYGRAAAVSKCDFSTFTFAVRALESVAKPSQGGVELHFTYDEEFGGELGPGRILSKGLSKPDLMIAAGFSYQVVTAHNGCLQLQVTIHGTMAHAAIPKTGADALQAATHLLNALYEQNQVLQDIHSSVEGIDCPYLNVGVIQGGTNTNVIPGKVVLKLDRRMIPEEDPVQVEDALRKLITNSIEAYAQQTQKPFRVEVERLLLAHAMRPLAGNAPLVAAVQQHAQTLFGEPIPALGTPLYTDVRLYAQHGIPGVIYGAGPRTVFESNAKRADERLNLEDLRRATKVIARTLFDLLQE
jgi:acetylornithine deacetylase/succinyl-diaminopimelate desuccinylase family protein